MKKILCIVITALMAVSMVHAEETADEPGSLGVGYQGIFFGDMINALSVRWAAAPIGGQIEIGEGAADIGTGVPGAGDVEAEIFMLKGKFYYALIERENSTFYAGASLGYYKVEIDNLGPGADAEVDGFSIAPLVGAEWRLHGLSELGLNFEVSYELIDLEYDVGGGVDDDIGLRGINISTGINYYF